MSSISTILLVICISITLCSKGQGAPILDDLFSGFIRDSQLTNQPANHGAIVKRRIYADNPDSRLKQVSLQSLISDVEDSLFNTALSVGSVAHNHEAIIPEVTPNTGADDTDRTITKRQTEEKTVGAAPTTTTTTQTNTANDVSELKNGQFLTTTEESPASKNILLQTTRKVPAANGVPAHILIDRVAVQPHEGGLPYHIPAFQVYHTKVISATFKEPNTNDGNGSGSTGGSTTSTKISIAQTAVQTTNAANGVPVITIATTNPSDTIITAATTTNTAATTGTVEEAIKSTATTQENTSTTNTATDSTTLLLSTTTPTTTTTTAATTKLPITQLKEAEEELKEKVAEIEAEPIILSARV